jgi:two-component system response regulator HydG
MQAHPLSNTAARTSTTPQPATAVSPSLPLYTAPSHPPVAALTGPHGPLLPRLRVLVIDPDSTVRNACAEIAQGLGFHAHAAESLAAARAWLASGTTDLILLDPSQPRTGSETPSGLTLLEELRVRHPEAAVIVMTAFATVDSAVEAMRLGAGDYLTKPFALEELATVLERAARRRVFDLESRRLREQLRAGTAGGGLIGRSPSMEKLYRILSKVAASSHPVLILGESGTGKELVARSIHSNGPNAARPFVPVDCGSLVPTLIESELFGHVKGAFTGANRAKTGLLAAAEGGTVFLDEIGELPLDLQARLLRALQEKEVRPVGSNTAVPIHARILAATNRDLAAMVQTGDFRKDLFFRLNVVNLRIPPLRERKSDIPLLAAHVLQRMQRGHGTAFTFDDESLHLMMQYDWPGNVRELENAIERACAMASGPVIRLADLPTQMQNHRLAATAAQAPPATGPDNTVLSIAELEKQAILTTLRQLNGDKLMAARLLGIGKTTLYRKLKEYGLADNESLI